MEYALPYVVRDEPGAPGRARILGALTGDTVQALLNAVDGGVAVLDLSKVHRVDDSGVRALARLRGERCTLLACPRWLELWLARVRREVEVQDRTGCGA